MTQSCSRRPKYKSERSQPLGLLRSMVTGEAAGIVVHNLLSHNELKESHTEPIDVALVCEMEKNDEEEARSTKEQEGSSRLD
ncbi:hypothetical protein U9M48_002363 [Paspalum notatum var. saurae]|uniref:Uncharacterized protein n=1 Tax=Paspalum notatum var. saurae TaxID=547442 RepID=A0AAQ3PQD7_PASNO